MTESKMYTELDEVKYAAKTNDDNVIVFEGRQHR